MSMGHHPKALYATRNAQKGAGSSTTSKSSASTAKSVSVTMLRKRWDEAGEKAKKAAVEAEDGLLASKIAAFRFRDIRPKAASEIKNIEDSSLLLGHTKSDITKRVYRCLGATVKPSK